MIIFYLIYQNNRNEYLNTWYPILGMYIIWLTWGYQIIGTYSQLKFSASLSEEYDWVVFANSPLLLLDIVITYLICFTQRFIFIWFIWYTLPHDHFILMSWFSYIKYIIINSKRLLTRQHTIRFITNSQKQSAVIYIKL